MPEATFTTDQVALAIEIPGVYDGTCVWLLKDGTLVNILGWGHRAARVEEWIAEHADAVRAQNADLLDPGTVLAVRLQPLPEGLYTDA